MDGLCPKCKTNPLDGLGKYCLSCREYSRKYVQAMRERRKNHGICIVCGMKPAMEGVGYCETCAIDCIGKVKTRRNRFEVAGLCIVCGRNAPKDDYKVCTECLEKSHLRLHPDNNTDKDESTECINEKQEAV